MKVTMDVGADGVALITISNPPVNSLSNPILTALMQKYDEANTRDDVKAIVIIGEGGKFSAGFDISVFTEVQKNGDLSLIGDVAIDLMVNRIEVSGKPSVAAIQGLALGGGLELAMACHARISTPKAQLGLPELSLGVIPGFGGTQMLPRLVGISKAIDMMLSSKPITSEEGKERGLIDAIVPPNELLKVARPWGLDIANRRKPWMSSLRRTDRIGSFSEARDIINAARQRAKLTAKNLPHHQGCLDVIEEGVIFGGLAGLLREAKVFKELVLSDTSKGLVHVFFAQRATAKIPGVTDVGLKPRKMQKVAVIGGGLMGSGIATALIVSGIHVILKEIHADFLKQGINRIADNLQGHVKKGIVPKAKFHEIMSLVTGVLDYSEFKNVDMVIEAVIEKVPLKQSIFNDLEKACPSHCILATNTSTIDLNVVGTRTHSQDRIIGAHFFSPAHIMPLLEIVRTEKTSPQAILDLMTLGKAIKKVPVVVGNCTGFAVNRTFFPYTAGAHLLANLGVDVFRIDRAISSFGMPMGPFQLQDLAGYDVALAVAVEFSAAFSDRQFNSPLVKLMVESGRYGNWIFYSLVDLPLGRRMAEDIYLYEKGSKPKPDPDVLPILEECRRRTNVMPGGKPISVSDQEIVEMVLFPVVNEACRVLDEGVVVRASDLDVASVLGMSFPSYRGGIVFWADTVGAGYIYSCLKKWAETYGPFYKPSAFLEQRPAKGLPLSSPSAAGKSMARM